MHRRTPIRAVASAGVLALATSSLLIAAPANAAEVVTYTVPGEQAPFVVPQHVSSITYTVVGGKGGDGSGPHGGLGGLPANITGTFPVVPGDVLTIWVAGAGQDGGGTGGDPGIGGAGFVVGGDGGYGGRFYLNEGDEDEIDLSASRPGAGGGGSSAVLLNSNLVVSAAGGGGGGGRGLDDVLFDACVGGAGGDAGLAGNPSAGGDNAPYFKCPVATGGPAGTLPEDPGGDAADVPQSLLNIAVGGAGGGGAGDGSSGNFSTAINGIFIRAAGGGGGGGGASFLNLALSADAEQTIAVLPEESTGDGYVTIEYVQALPATGVANIPVFATGALVLLLAGGAILGMRRRGDAQA
jgi:LPXTG-motif cell wall-anchored protein